MKFIEAKDYQEMSQKAAEFLLERIRQKPSIKLGLATGSTPVGMYEILVNDHKENQTSYKDIMSFNLDEYVGLSGDDPNSYRYFMDEHLFNHVDINKHNTYVPKGNVDDLEKECEDHEKRIEEHGGVDLQVLGIGGNGHIGFNEPGTSFDSKTHVVDLDASTIEANARFFNTIEEVPTQALSMGISTILKSKEILLLISGESKRDAFRRLLHEGVSQDFPASVLKNHPNVTVIADKAAIGDEIVQP